MPDEESISITEQTHIFGPVPSRRLGRSLGIDIAPYKTCTYDCIYCQLGRTIDKTLERRVFTPVQSIVDELKTALEHSPQLDYLTLSGSGEPTLYKSLGELIAAIKKISDIPLAVLTNGSLLWMKEVRDELAEADLVIPSMDAGDKAMFNFVNRPHPDLVFDKILEGLCAFREEFPKPIWLEVFLLGGITSVESDVNKLAVLAQKVHADRIQLNTVKRPPAESYSYPVSKDRTLSLFKLFGDRAELIASGAVSSFKNSDRIIDASADRKIIELLKRRPCTLMDVCNGLGLHPTETSKMLERLMESGSVSARFSDSERFFTVN